MGITEDGLLVAGGMGHSREEEDEEDEEETTETAILGSAGGLSIPGLPGEENNEDASKEVVDDDTDLLLTTELFKFDEMKFEMDDLEFEEGPPMAHRRGYLASVVWIKPEEPLNEGMEEGSEEEEGEYPEDLSPEVQERRERRAAKKAEKREAKELAALAN